MFWLLLGMSAACWALFLYPYLIYPQLLKRLGERPIRPRPVELGVSLLFCAYNEADCLPGKLDNLRELKRASPELEILVYDDASSDGTYQMLAEASDLLTVVPGPGRTGKAAGMRRLAALAKGEVLVFTDANVLLSPDLIHRLLPYYGDPQVGGVSGTIRTTGRGGSVTGDVGSTYVKVDERLQQLESRTGNVMGASGGLFSVRRELYPEFPDTVQDDFTVSMSVIFRGKRLIKATDVIAFEHSVERREEELRRKIRIGARAFHTHRFIQPQVARMSGRDRMKYVSRKMLRWFGGLFVIGGALFGLAGAALLSPVLALGLLVVGLAVGVLAMRARRGLLAKLGEAGLATFATLFGVFKGMGGGTVATWAPAKSR